jgi:hypothetical protein
MRGLAVSAKPCYITIIQNNQGETTMSVTLTANFADTLKPATVEFIKANQDEYALPCMLEFIDEHNEDDFVQFYDDYIEQGENLGYDVVDAFIEENGIVNVEHAEDAFVGCYDSEAAFAEEYMEDMHHIPVELVVDWQATWETSLKYDFDFCNGYVFRRHY